MNITHKTSLEVYFNEKIYKNIIMCKKDIIKSFYTYLNPSLFIIKKSEKI